METVHEVPHSAELLRLECDIACTPETVYRYWTDPALLAIWWATWAELDVREGGTYHLVFKGETAQFDLRGSFTRVAAPERLTFTWNWDHTPEIPAREVDIVLTPGEEGGTHLAVTHGRYTEADTEERQSHVDGWTHFLGRLQAVCESQ